MDFEGEPARPLSERRAKVSPLKDVAGMIRSFHYAAHLGLQKAAAHRPADFARFEPAADFWYSWTTAVYLKEYRQALPTGIVPEDTALLELMLDWFLFDKTLYEVLYEINHRPSWAAIPLDGLRMLAAIPAGAHAR